MTQPVNDNRPRTTWKDWIICLTAGPVILVSMIVGSALCVVAAFRILAWLGVLDPLFAP